MFDWHFYVQAAISMLLITSPPDPAKIVFFNTTVEREGRSRTASALRVAMVVLVILVGAAFIGKQLLELLGINLDAFRVVGGLIIAGMGFEMLAGGQPSRAQGRDRIDEGPQETDGLIIPLAIPLIAGPGAIVTAISISSASAEWEGVIAASIGALVVAIVTFGSLEWLGGAISKLSAQTTALLVRIGGLLLATIGVQMLLGGLKNFFA